LAQTKRARRITLPALIPLNFRQHRHQPLAPPDIRCHRSGSAPPRRSGHRGSPAPLSRASPHRGRPPPPSAIHGAAAARLPNKRAADHCAHRADFLQSPRPPPPIPRQMPTATSLPSPASPQARPSTASPTSLTDPSPCAAATADPSRGLAYRWSGFFWSRRLGRCETPGPKENFTAAPLRHRPLRSAPVAMQVSATDLHSAS
jgi:hypothetical protein